MRFVVGLFFDAIKRQTKPFRLAAMIIAYLMFVVFMLTFVRHRCGYGQAVHYCIVSCMPHVMKSAEDSY